MKLKKWTKKEEDFLRGNYIKLTYNEMASALNRRKKQVEGKLNSLNLKKSKYVSKSELLKNYYSKNYHHTKNVPKSEEQKRKDIEKINKKALEDQKKAAMVQWTADSVAAAANVGMSISNQLRGGDPYTAIPRSIAAGLAAGAAATTVIANKPRFENGGIWDGQGIVDGTSFTGDSTLARVNAGEGYLNREQLKNLYEMINGGGTTNNNQRTNNIYVNALDPQTTSEAVVNALVHAQQNGGYDTSILSLGA